MRFFRLVIPALILSLASIVALPAQQKTSTSVRKWVTMPGHPDGGKFVHFMPRAKMARTPLKPFAAAVPVTPLPVDCSGGQRVNWPMDGNDNYGDCYEAASAHADSLLTYGQGKAPWTQSNFVESALISQYLAKSNGDNGLSRSDIFGPGGIYITGIAGMSGSWPNSKAVVYESLEINPTNVEAIQYAIDQFYGVMLEWSVPDSFVNDFTHAKLYDGPVVPDPANGHAVVLTDVSAAGNYTLVTWGDYCFVTQKFVSEVDPAIVVGFGARQFNPATGLDSKGRHITAQNQKWVAMGGTGLPASVISAFPPAGNPPPPPPPPNPTPTPATTITLNGDLKAGTYSIVSQSQLDAISAKIDKTKAGLMQIINDLEAQSKAISGKK